MIEGLPEEMVEEILDKLTLEELMAFREVSHQFLRLTTTLILRRKFKMIQSYATTVSWSDSMRYFQDMIYTNPFHQNPKLAKRYILSDSDKMRSPGIPYATNIPYAIKVLLGTTDEFQSVLRERKKKMFDLRRKYKNRQAAKRSRGLNPQGSATPIPGLLGDIDEFQSVLCEHKENVSSLRRQYQNRPADKKSRGLNQHESIKSFYLSINLF